MTLPHRKMAATIDVLGTTDRKGDDMKIRNWLKTVPALAIIGTILFVVLAVGGGLLLWGSNFADHIVHTQLSEQKVSFPPKGSPGLDPKEFPGLQQYAGQTVDNGPKAKAYADEFIRVHLKAIGMTYSEASGKVQAALAQGQTPDPKLVGQVDTLFKGETLRGLLLNVWGWATMGAIAFWVGIAALLGALAVLGALALGFVMHERQTRAVRSVDLTTSTSVPADGATPRPAATVG